MPKQDLPQSAQKKKKLQDARYLHHSRDLHTLDGRTYVHRAFWAV